jgi:hypothetical protein
VKQLAVFLLVLVSAAGARPAISQTIPRTAKPSAMKPVAAEEAVREWFRRWNALDGSESSTKRFLDLYQPDAMHQISPSEKQIGPVYLEGIDAIRKLADDFTRVNTQPAFRIESMSSSGKTSELFFGTVGPWGGSAIGVQYVAIYTDRATKKRYAQPGFAVFHIEDGKILYARFYTTRDEKREM